MLLFPLFLLIIQLSFINTRSTNNNGTRHPRRSTPKVYDVEFVLRQAQNDNDFDEPPSKSSVVYPSSAIIPEEEGDGIEPLGSFDDEDDVIDGEDKEIKRMPSRFYRRRFGNRYIRPFVGGGGGGMPTMVGGGGMPMVGGGGGMPPFGYGMRRPGGMALGGMNINGMGGNNMGPMGSGMSGGGGMGMPMNGGMGSGMMNGNDGMNGGGGGGMGSDGSDGSDDMAYPSRFNYRRPFPMVPNPDGMRGNGINGYGTYGPSNGNSNNNNGNWFNNNNNNYGDGFNGGGVGYGYQFRGGNSMLGIGGGGMGPSQGGYGPSSCGPMGCGSGGGGGSGMMGSNMGGGQGGMMRPGGGGGPGGFYMGGFPGGPSMMGKGGMGMGGGWNGPMGANMGGGGDDGDGGMGDGMMGGGMNGDGPPTGAVGIHMSNNGYSYAAYIERQVRSTTIMMYTLVGCAPCQRAKHMLAVHYADVKSHFLELVGDEDWQRQLQVDLQHVTGAMTFPYIFVCGNYIGGSTDLIALHQSGQLRRMVNSCSRKVVAKAAVAAVAASV